MTHTMTRGCAAWARDSIFGQVEINGSPDCHIALIRPELGEVAGAERSLQTVRENQGGAEPGFAAEARKCLPQIRVRVVRLAGDAASASLHPVPGVG